MSGWMRPGAVNYGWSFPIRSQRIMDLSGSFVPVPAGSSRDKMRLLGLYVVAGDALAVGPHVYVEVINGRHA